MPTYVYRKDKSGNVRRLLLSERLLFKGDERPAELKERVIKAYYAEECNQGSRFKSGYGKNEIKQVWETNDVRR